MNKGGKLQKEGIQVGENLIDAKNFQFPFEKLNPSIV